MLKIKDNVDLKELEKYGFEKCKNFYYFSLGSNNYGCFIDFLVDIEDKEICLEADTKKDGMFYTYDLSIIYDLIQAGLVEKVEG